MTNENYNKDVYINFGKKCIALIFPPRTGGTTECLKLGLEDGKFVYINNRHASIQHAVNVLDKVFSIDCIYVSGKHRMETSPPKVNCKKAIVFDPWFGKLYGQHFGVDGYRYLIKLGQKGELSILTVPQVAIRDIEPQGTLIIDEESTIEFFKPKSQLLYSIDWSDSIRRNESGHKITLENCVKKVLQNIPKKLKKQYPEFEKWLKQLCELLEEAYRGWDRSKLKLKEHIMQNILPKLPKPPYHETDEEEKEEIVFDLLKKGWEIEHYEVIEFFISALYFLGYHLHSTKTKHNIFLVADESKLILKNWLNKWDRIIIRVNSAETADWFFRNLGRDYEKREKEFPYINNFIVVHSDVETLAIMLWEQQIPYLILTATKKEAERVKKWCKQNKIDAEIVDDKTDLEQIYRLTTLGRVPIYYQNSTISRGIDLPIYDIVLVFSVGFACPYEEFVRDTNAVKEKIARETEQCVMRISPIRGCREDSVKFVVFDRRINITLPTLQVRYLGTVPTDCLAELAGLFSVKLEITPTEGSMELMDDGSPFSFYGFSLYNYYMISRKTITPETALIILKRLLTHKNPKIPKTTLRNCLKIDQLRDLIDALGRPVDGLPRRFSKLKELHGFLKECGISDVLLQKYLIRVMRELDMIIPDETGKGWIVQIKTLDDYVREVIAEFCDDGIINIFELQDIVSSLIGGWKREILKNLEKELLKRGLGVYRSSKSF